MALSKHTKIFTVFSFLRLRGQDIFWYKWVYPTIVFLIIFIGSQIWGDWFRRFDTDKLVGDVNVLMGTLIGFYIAALAAVSSFSSENLDQVMKGRPPTLTTVQKGDKIEEKLTRRRFLAILFGYCATLAIILYVFGVLHVHMRLSGPSEPFVSMLETIGQVAWWLYVWIVSSLLVVTLLGLHYLVERIHRRE